MLFGCMAAFYMNIQYTPTYICLYTQSTKCVYI